MPSLFSAVFFGLLGLVAWPAARRFWPQTGPKRVAEGHLTAWIGRRVVLAGVYHGRAESAWPQGVRPSAPHPDATSSITKPVPYIIREGRRIEVRGPVQVVSGRAEGRKRAVRSGDRVRVEGRLVSVGSEGEAEHDYREAAGGFALEGDASEAWPLRPVAVYGLRAVSGSSMVVALGAALVCTAMFPAMLVDRSPIPVAPAAIGVSCVPEADRLIESGDPRRLADAERCDDERIRAEAAWILGDVEEAARHFAFARALHPEQPWSAAEVEAELLRSAGPLDSETALPVERAVEHLRDQWFTGPDVDAKRVLSCISTRLVPVLAGAPDPLRPRGDEPGAPMADACQLGAPRSTHYCSLLQGEPTYALHDPTRFGPLFSLRDPGAFPEQVSWRSDACDAERARYGAALLGAPFVANRALLAAVAGDREAYDELAVTFDGWPAEVARLGPGGAVVTSYARESEAQHLLRSPIGVVAAAAFHLDDLERFRRFTSLAEPHTRAVFTEFRELEAGRRKQVRDRVPSEYTEVDAELFALRERDPARVIASLPAGYRLTSRLAALVGDSSEVRDSLRLALAHGFWAMPRNQSSLQTLHALFARRKAAELAGDAELAESLRVAGQKHHRALTRSANHVAAFSFESVVLDR